MSEYLAARANIDGDVDCELELLGTGVDDITNGAVGDNDKAVSFSFSPTPPLPSPTTPIPIVGLVPSVLAVKENERCGLFGEDGDNDEKDNSGSGDDDDATPALAGTNGAPSVNVGRGFGRVGEVVGVVASVLGTKTSC
ncbi:hypothetical protein FACS1894152_8420 [Bacilli bacterium]|nr:hypothetical protein FACS1894152_8420 [Bacilli bacterium]